MRRAFTCAILALPFLIVSTVADAQQGKNKQSKNQMSDEVIEARKECFAEAQARYPGGDQRSEVLQSNRYAAYTGCAQRKGIRP
jgi:hypothetical protein